MQMIERIHHICKRSIYEHSAYEHTIHKCSICERNICKRKIFRHCISRLFLWVLVTFCLSIVICNSVAMAIPDVNKTQKPNENVIRVVSGIISYTHWPVTRTTLRLCLVPPSDYINVLTHLNMISDHTELQIETLDFNIEQLIEKCDVIYYGQVDPQLQQQVISQKNNKPLLTIAENNPRCEIGSAFCLNIDSTQATFSLNFDILARSGVRVHPNVLQLARKVE
ncbi:hypothetical protein Xszus_00434 [Xenorhabdus szentirmaii]|nr:hypothetical protein Xszus_00434 [Xenorhabdus szentirmaii]